MVYCRVKDKSEMNTNLLLKGLLLLAFTERGAVALT